jgi:hypothetical protein
VSPRRPAAARSAPSERKPHVREGRPQVPKGPGQLIERAREAVPTLPTPKLKRLQDLLERVLSQAELDATLLAELERLLED